MSKQTGVDFLMDKLFDPSTMAAEQIQWFEQAKELEKQQMENTWAVAHQSGRFEGKGIAEENWQTFEDYYNENYGGDQ